MDMIDVCVILYVSTIEYPQESIQEIVTVPVLDPLLHCKYSGDTPYGRVSHDFIASPRAAVTIQSPNRPLYGVLDRLLMPSLLSFIV